MQFVKTTVTTFVLILTLCAITVLLAPGLGSTGAKQMSPDPTTWAVQGLFTDACQCRVFCPCEMADKPTFGHCKDTAVLHIEKGHYGAVSLDGRQVVVVSRSPDDERLVDTVGRLVFAHLYVSDQATDAQAEALAEVARRIFGAWTETGVTRLSENETMQRVPLQVVIEPHRHKVQIPGKLALDVEALVGWDGENPVRIANGPAAGPGHGDILVARSHKYRVTDHGLDWDFPGRSASMRTVDLTGRIDDAPAPAADSGAEPMPHDHAGH